jgi:hypothetical protein
MVKQKTQYKRNPQLKRKFGEHMKQARAYTERRKAWLALLSDNPSASVVASVSDLLARLGFTPDAEGYPLGEWSEWPVLPKQDTLVFLDALAEGVHSNDIRETTLQWKADMLSVASLIWAGVITEENDDVRLVYPRCTWMEALMLARTTDLDSFWGRRGVGKTKADIRAMWESAEPIMDERRLQDSLRRARGGTY